MCKKDVNDTITLYEMLFTLLAIIGLVTAVTTKFPVYSCSDDSIDLYSYHPDPLPLEWTRISSHASCIKGCEPYMNLPYDSYTDSATTSDSPTAPDSTSASVRVGLKITCPVYRSRYLFPVNQVTSTQARYIDPSLLKQSGLFRGHRRGYEYTLCIVKSNRTCSYEPYQNSYKTYTTKNYPPVYHGPPSWSHFFIPFIKDA